MKFKSNANFELDDLVKEVQLECDRLIQEGFNIFDVDFLIDNEKMLKYRAVIKYSSK